MKKVLILAGPSAVGKTTLMSEILSRGDGFEFIRSATTRAPRGDGRDQEYIYLTKEEFFNCVKRAEMLEYTEYGGNMYGTPKYEIDRIFSDGKIPLLILDINGVKALKALQSDFYAYSVYVTADIEVLDARLYERAEKDGLSCAAMDIYERRRAKNRSETEEVGKLSGVFDLIVENRDVSECVDSILNSFKK